MDIDAQELKEKTLLLLQREREVLELRRKHERLAVWLKVAQSLPTIFTDSSLSVGDLYAKLRKALLDGLKLQRVLFFEIDFDRGMLCPLVPAGPCRSLGPEVLAMIRADPFGTVNDAQSPGGAALAEAFGLARLIWSRIDVKGLPPVILAAGFDRTKAECYPPFDPSEAANLRNTGQHIEGLVGNATLVTQLRAMAGDLRTANETLEQHVAERTAQLGHRNRDMRMVLDNVPMALVTIDPAGRLAEERSAKVDEWFGAYAGTPSFVDYIAATDPEFATWFSLGFEALLDRYLPLELCLDQLPKRVRGAQRNYQCSYRPIGGAEDKDVSVLIMIEDVTDRLRLEQGEAEKIELLALCEGLTRDRTGFLTFFEEADRLVSEITEVGVDPAVRKRHLHTLKGNAAMMNVSMVANLCHRAEDEDADDSAIEEVMRQLQQRWSAIRRTIEAMLGGRGKDIVEVPSSGLAQLCRDIDHGLSRAEIQQRLTFFTFEPIDRPLGRLTRHAKALADRLGKPNLSVAIESDNLWVEPHQFDNLWSALVHVVRNAIDHGIESPAERIAQGKAAEGYVKIRAWQKAGELTIEIEDDGRGIDWERVAELAAERGLPHACEADLVRALLSDGFSTRKAVSETSGRGVGLSAVHKEIELLGGVLSVKSQRGGGTCFRMTLPQRPAGAGPVAGRNTHGTLANACEASPTRSFMNNESLAILDTIIKQSALGLFASSGVNLQRIDSLPEKLDHTFAATIGFTGPDMLGMLVLTLDRELAALSRPPELQARPLSEPELDDWVGELVNQLMGRIKNKLHRYRIELMQSIPSVVRGRWLRRGIPEAPVSCAQSFSHETETVYICLDAMVKEGLELKVATEEHEAVGEGEISLF